MTLPSIFRLAQQSAHHGLLALALLAAPMVNAAPLTLEQALNLAATHSPALAAAEAQEQGAQAALTTAQIFQNPGVEISSGQASSRQTGNASGGRIEMVGISQLIELPSLRNARREGAEAGVTSGSAALESARLNQRSAVKQAFFEVLRSLDASVLAAENHALLLQIRNRVKLRVEVGEAARYELVKSEAETLAAESAARSAELRVTQARSRLRALIGAPLAPSFEVVPEPLLPANLPVLSELRLDMLAQQPQLKVREAETRRAEAGVAQERAARLPQPTIRLSLQREPDMSQWNIGVSLPLPLWNRRAGSVREAMANLQWVEAQTQQMHLGLLAELDQAYGRYEIAKGQVETFESGLMKMAEGAMKVAEAAYHYGERGILDYLDAQRVLRTTRMDYLNARYELQAAMIDIERLRATPIAGDPL